MKSVARRTMLWAGVALTTGLLGATPVAGIHPEHSIRLRFGVFDPQGSSEYWDDKFVDFSGNASDFEDLVGGADYFVKVRPFLGILLSVDAYEGQSTQEYREFVDNRGFAIEHDTYLSVVPVTAAVVLHFGDRRAPVRPYLGVGGGMWIWELEEAGDFIDFGGAPPEVFFGRFVDDGVALGFFGIAGFEVPLGREWSLLLEGRFDEVDDELGGDFEGFGDLDLSGVRVMGGFSFRF